MWQMCQRFEQVNLYGTRWLKNEQTFDISENQVIEQVFIYGIFVASDSYMNYSRIDRLWWFILP
jgi:hypothetical protein